MMGASWFFFMNRTERFLALPVVLFALWTGSSLTGEGLGWVRARRLAAVLCGVNLAINVAASESIGLWAVSIGGQSRDAFLESHVQCHFISKVMSQALSGSQRALLVGEARTYPFDVPVATSYPFSTPPIVAAMQESQTAEDLWRGLTRRGFSHVLLNLSSSERLAGAYDYFHPYERLWEDPVFTEFLDDFCSKICEDRGGDIQLYELKGASGGDAGEVSSSQGG
jgi:hypothetical protein